MSHYSPPGAGSYLAHSRFTDPGTARRQSVVPDSDLEIGFQLPSEYFEHASSAWQAMRSSGDHYDPDRHAEEPQDGRSHIRSQSLSDFTSLLKHDLAGVDEPDQETAAFIRGQTYTATPAAELSDLDDLAALISAEPSVDELITFYITHERLRIRGAELDPYSFVFRG